MPSLISLKPFFTVKFTLFSYAPALISLSITKVWLSHLTIWCFERTALFFLAKAALAYLPTALSVALKPLYAQVFLLTHAPFCKFFGTVVSAAPKSLPLLFYLTLATLSSSIFYFNLPGKSCLLSSCTIKLRWIPGHSYPSGNDAAEELA